MASREKIQAKLFSSPSITWLELQRVMAGLGFKQIERAGSRVCFCHPELGLLHIHRPHPGKNLKPYQLRKVREFLEKECGLGNS